MSAILIRPFASGNQTAVRALVLAGLKDHFGELDPTLNRDLDDWLDAIALYRSCGFGDERFADGDIHLVLNLNLCQTCEYR